MDEWVEERDETSWTLKTEILLKSCGRALAEHTNTQNVLHFGKPFFLCELKDLRTTHTSGRKANISFHVVGGGWSHCDRRVDELC